MKTLIFKNGATIDFVECYGRNEYVQGSQRSVLDFRFNPNDISLDDVDKMFSADECGKLIIRDAESEFIHENYNIRVSISKQKFTLATEDGSTEVEQISVKIAQCTYIEIQLTALGIKI